MSLTKEVWEHRQLLSMVAVAETLGLISQKENRPNHHHHPSRDYNSLSLMELRALVDPLVDSLSAAHFELSQSQREKLFVNSSSSSSNSSSSGSSSGSSDSPKTTRSPSPKKILFLQLINAKEKLSHCKKDKQDKQDKQVLKRKSSPELLQSQEVDTEAKRRSKKMKTTQGAKDHTVTDTKEMLKEGESIKSIKSTTRGKRRRQNQYRSGKISLQDNREMYSREMKSKQIDYKDINTKEINNKEINIKEINIKELNINEINSKGIGKIDNKEIDSKEIDNKEVGNKEIDSREMDNKEIDSKKIDNKEIDNKEIDITLFYDDNNSIRSTSERDRQQVVLTFNTTPVVTTTTATATAAVPLSITSPSPRPSISVMASTLDEEDEAKECDISLPDLVSDEDDKACLERIKRQVTEKMDKCNKELEDQWQDMQSKQNGIHGIRLNARQRKKMFKEKMRYFYKWYLAYCERELGRLAGPDPETKFKTNLAKGITKCNFTYRQVEDRAQLLIECLNSCENPQMTEKRETKIRESIYRLQVILLNHLSVCEARESLITGVALRNTLVKCLERVKGYPFKRTVMERMLRLLRSYQQILKLPEDLQLDFDL